MNKSKLKIVHQFSLLAIVALLVMVGLALLDFHHKSTIDEIIQQEEQLLSLRKQLTDIEREILRARLEEFQMIASRKSSFFDQFEKKIENIFSMSDALTKNLMNLQNNEINEPKKIMLKTLNRYHKSVRKTFKLEKKMGLNGKQGLLIDLRFVKNNIKGELYTFNNKALNFLFIRMQLLEKDFSNTLNMKLANQLLTLVSTFSEEIKQKNLSKTRQEKLRFYLMEYRDKMSQLINKTVEIELSIATSTLQFERIFPNLQKSQSTMDKLITLKAEQLGEQLHTSKLQTTAIFIAAFIILSIFMFFQIRHARSLVERLQQLAEGMRYVASGHFEKVTHLSQEQDEVGLLATTFDRMASQIKSQMAIIEKEHNLVKKEKEKSDKLLLNILPPPIATRLKQKEKFIADRFENATVLFCDLVNFTNMSASIAPEELVQTLNMIFSHFDELTKDVCIEKIKTIGDAYMIVGGVPNPCDNHAEHVAQVALQMIDFIKKIAKSTGKPLSIRVGIHSGEVVAGVIGTTKMAYDLWGDTVNTASRMESHGIPGKIQCSETVYHRLKDRFQFEFRGAIKIKGKGLMRTYFLVKQYGGLD